MQPTERMQHSRRPQRNKSFGLVLSRYEALLLQDHVPRYRITWDAYTSDQQPYTNFRTFRVLPLAENS
jgi:hypothetical protein